MKTKQANLAILLMIVANLVYGGVLYAKLPPIIATHWDVNMHPNGWGSKWTTVILLPSVTLIFLVMLNLLPRLNTRGLSIEPFLPTFNLLMVVAAAYMTFVSVLLLEFPLHPGLPFGKLLMTGVLVLFGILGNFFGKLRRNPWIGIRTPWTLASDTVWIATHRFAARLTVIASLIGIAVVWVGAPIWTAIALILGVSLAAAIYSYLIARRDEGLHPSGAKGHQP